MTNCYVLSLLLTCFPQNTFHWIDWSNIFSLCCLPSLISYIVKHTIFIQSFYPASSPYYISQLLSTLFIIAVSLTNACYVHKWWTDKQNKQTTEKCPVSLQLYTSHTPRVFKLWYTWIFQGLLKQIIHGKIEIYFYIPYSKTTEERLVCH
jgi:hypothetical protein